MTDPRMTPTNDAPVTVEPMGPLWHSVQQVHDEAMRDNLTAEQYRTAMLAALASAPAGDRVGQCVTKIMDERATYFDRTTGHFDRADAARSYRATKAELLKSLAALARPRAAVGERDVDDRLGKEAIADARAMLVNQQKDVIARIIDSRAFDGPIYRNLGSPDSAPERRADALDKADAILALQSPPAKVEGV